MRAAMLQIHKDYFIFKRHSDINVQESRRVPCLLKLPFKKTATGQHHYSFLGVKWYNSLHSRFNHDVLNIDMGKFRDILCKYLKEIT